MILGAGGAAGVLGADAAGLDSGIGALPGVSLRGGVVELAPAGRGAVDGLKGLPAPPLLCDGESPGLAAGLVAAGALSRRTLRLLSVFMVLSLISAK